MKTRYIIEKSPQGTSLSEVAKAKRIYLAGVKSGKYFKAAWVTLIFFDFNGKVSVKIISNQDPVSINDVVFL